MAIVFPAPPFVDARLYALRIWVGVNGSGPAWANGRASKRVCAFQFTGAALTVDSVPNSGMAKRQTNAVRIIASPILFLRNLIMNSFHLLFFA